MRKQRAPVEINDQLPDSGYDGSMSADMAQQGLIVEGLFFARVGGVCVADFQIEKKGASWTLHTEVAPEWRRQGVASSIYDQVEAWARAVGAALAPSDFQTEDAKAFWANRVQRESLSVDLDMSSRLSQRRSAIETRCSILAIARPSRSN